MAFRQQQQYVDYSDGVPDKVKQFVVYFYRHIRYAHRVKIALQNIA